MNHVIEYHHLSERKACGLIRLAHSTKRYRARPRDDEPALWKPLCGLAAEQPRFGYRRLTALLRREGRYVNPKRVHRLYREDRVGAAPQGASQAASRQHALSRAPARQRTLVDGFRQRHIGLGPLVSQLDPGR